MCCMHAPCRTRHACKHDCMDHAPCHAAKCLPRPSLHLQRVHGCHGWCDALGLAASACTAGDGNTAGTIVCDSTHGTPGGTTGSCTCTCADGYGGIDCATGSWSMHRRSLHALSCMHHPALCIHVIQNCPAYLRMHACHGLMDWETGLCGSKPMHCG